jgi:hypothetical protein
MYVIGYIPANKGLAGTYTQQASTEWSAAEV